MLKEQPPLADNEEYVSYDVESLFTNIPIKETIDYILTEIYDKHTIPPICSKLIFKRLLLKLTTESTFIFNNNFYKQTDGCTMGGPLSVIFSDIFMTKMELDALKPPMDRALYKRYVDDIFTRRFKNEPDTLLEFLNNYHPRIKLTVEINPEKFLDTRIIVTNDKVCKTEVFRKETKVTPHWSSCAPKRFKRNAINGELYRADKISSNFNEEKSKIWKKFEKACYPQQFVKSVFRDYNNKKLQKEQLPMNDDELLIPENFFETPKPTIMMEIPFCQENEKTLKRFLTRFHQFTKNTYKINVKWITKKMKTLFTLKDRNPYPSCQIYQGTCTCGESYIGETIRNVKTRWEEHENIKKDSEPAKHLKTNPRHYFDWKTLLPASKNYRHRKNLEASFIATKRPSLNNQLDTKMLLLFRNGIT